MRSLCCASVLLALCGVLLLTSPIALGSDAAVSREDQLKAAFLYNFTKFIEWPAQSFSAANAPIVIGVLGHTPLEAELARLTRSRNINGRAILVKRVDTADEARATHLLFVSAEENAGFAAVQAALDNSPVVVVGESQGFAATGGTINFVLEEDKVRFEINISSAERAGLKISAQLQKLATHVRRTTW